jgi:hypothetical protein
MYLHCSAVPLPSGGVCFLVSRAATVLVQPNFFSLDDHILLFAHFPHPFSHLDRATCSVCNVRFLFQSNNTCSVIDVISMRSG